MIDSLVRLLYSSVSFVLIDKGRIDRKPLLDIVFTDSTKPPAGPFSTVKEFHGWLSALVLRGTPPEATDPFREHLPDDSKVFFSLMLISIEATSWSPLMSLARYLLSSIGISQDGIQSTGNTVKPCLLVGMVRNGPQNISHNLLTLLNFMTGGNGILGLWGIDDCVEGQATLTL